MARRHRPWAAYDYGALANAGELDALEDPVLIYSDGEPVAVDPRDEYERSTVGHYHNAIRKWRNGDADITVFEEFIGVTVGGRELETQADALYDLALRGLLAPEDIYLLR